MAADQLKKITINDWTNKFKVLYEVPDAARKPEDFWIAVMAHLSVMGEKIRTTDYGGLVKSATHAFCWMTSYISNCDREDDPVFLFKASLSEIAAFKYPRVCAHCQKDLCECKSYELDQYDNKSAKYKSLLDKWNGHKDWSDWTFMQFMDMFWNIFGVKIHIQSLESIGFHLLEEAGEEAKAVRILVQYRGVLNENINGLDIDFLKRISFLPELVNEYEQAITFAGKNPRDMKDYTNKNPEVVKARFVLAKMDFVSELADTFLWFCSVLLKVDKMLQTIYKDNEDTANSFDFETNLSNEYNVHSIGDAAKCYACKKEKCKCLFFPKRT